MERKHLIQFSVHCSEASPGDIVGICGASEELGQWQPERCLPLTTSKELFPIWTLKDPVWVPPGTLYNFVIRTSSGTLCWEAAHPREVPINVPGRRPVLLRVAATFKRLEQAIKVEDQLQTPNYSQSAACLLSPTPLKSVSEARCRPAERQHDGYEATTEFFPIQTPIQTPRAGHYQALQDLAKAEHYLLTPRMTQSRRTSYDSEPAQATLGADRTKMLTSIAGGALAFGAGGGLVGLLSGGAIGAACGFIPAVLTFGASIPVGAVIGAAAGVGAGTTTGGIAGAIGGWALCSHAATRACRSKRA